MNPHKSYRATDRMRDLVKDNSLLILVISRFSMSLGFGENTVREVCRSHNVDEDTFLAVANFVSEKECEYDSVSLPSLIGYLKNAHEYFLEFNLPNIRRKLLESLDCSSTNDIAILILRFYDEYVTEVRRHMEFENNVVFTYVEQLSQGFLNQEYSISAFAGKHTPIGDKLKELKDVIIRCYPEKNNYLLNSVLLDIIQCEEDLNSHCQVEDRLFVPAVRDVELQIKKSGKILYYENSESTATQRDKTDELSSREKDIIVCLTKGLSNKEIAENLSISINTVTTHRRNISNKLQIHTSAGLVIYAIANQLVNIKDVR